MRGRIAHAYRRTTYQGILCNNEGSLAIDYKQRFELTKSLTNVLNDIPLLQPDGAQNKSTEEKQTSTEKTEHQSQITDIIAILGKSIHDELFSLKTLMLNLPDASKSPTTPCPTRTPQITTEVLSVARRTGFFPWKNKLNRNKEL